MCAAEEDTDSLLVPHSYSWGMLTCSDKLTYGESYFSPESERK